MFCGAFIFSMNLSMQVAGRHLTSAWGCIVAVIHLYNASTKTKFNTVCWPDLDYPISINGEKYLFYGGAPEDSCDYQLKYRLEMRYSLSESAANRRNNQKYATMWRESSITSYLLPKHLKNDTVIIWWLDGESTLAFSISLQQA